MADAHLDLTTLDADLAEATAKLTAAFERIEREAVVQVTADTDRALAEIRALDSQVTDLAANVEVVVDETSVALARTEIESLVGDITAHVTVVVDTGAALAELTALDALARDRVVNVDVNVDDSGLAAAAAAAQATFIEDPPTITPQIIPEVDLDEINRRINADLFGIDLSAAAELGAAFDDALNIDGSGFDQDTQRRITSVRNWTASLREAAAAGEKSLTFDRAEVAQYLAGFAALQAAGQIDPDVDIDPFRDAFVEASKLKLLLEDGATFDLDISDLSNLAQSAAALRSEGSSLTNSFRELREESERFDAFQGRIDGLYRAFAKFNTDLRGSKGLLGDAVTQLDAIQEAGTDVGAVFRFNKKDLQEYLRGLEKAKRGVAEAGGRIEYDTDLSPIDVAIAKLGALGLAKQGADGTLTIDADVQDVLAAIAEIETLRATTSLADGQTISIDTDVDSAGSSFQRLLTSVTGLIGGGGGGGGGAFYSGFLGLGDAAQKASQQVNEGFSGIGESATGAGTGLAGMGAKAALLIPIIVGVVNLVGALVASIATLVAYLVPLATGLVGAGAGLLLFGAGAAAAVAGAGALVLLLEGTLDQFKQTFEGFKQIINTTLLPALEPVREFLVGALGRALDVVAVAVGKLAPVFEQAFGPVIEAILPLIEIFGELSGPLAIAVGQGLAGLIDQFTRFIAATDVSVAVAGIEQLFRLINSLVEILAETGLNFPLVELLSSLANVVDDAIDPFLEIVATFAPAIGVLGESLSNIFGPFGEQAVVFGQAVAALAPYFDEFFSLFEALVPLFDVEVLGTIFTNVVPEIAQTLERLSPVLERISDLWIELFDILTTDDILDAFSLSLESTFLVLEEFLAVTVEYPFLIEGIVRAFAGLGAALAFLAGASEITIGIVIEAFGRLAQVAAQGATAVLLGVGKIAQGLGAILPGNDRFEQAADDILGFRDDIIDAATGLANFGSARRRAGINILSGQLEIARGTAAGATAELDSYGRTARRTATQVLRLASAQKSLTEITGALEKVFAPATKTIEDALTSFKSGEKFAEFIYDEAAAVDTAAKANRGILSDYLRAEGEEAEDVQSAAIARLELGAISDYMDRENLNIDRAINSLIQKLQTKGENLRRLQELSNLGLGPLAQQLATLSDDPRMLAKAIDDITAQGIGAMRAANARIFSAQAPLLQQMGNLDPDLAEALGINRDSKAAGAIDDQAIDINAALGRLTDGLALRSSNLSRIASLYAQGFTGIATELAAISDPADLAASLDGLATIGEQGLRNYNSRILAGYAEIEAQQANLPTSLKEAMGIPLEEGADALKESSERSIKTFQEAFADYNKSFTDEIRKTNALAILVASDFDSVAVLLANVDAGEPFDKLLGDFVAASPEAQGAFEAALQQQGADLIAAQENLINQASTEAILNNDKLAKVVADALGVTVDELRDSIIESERLVKAEVEAFKSRLPTWLPFGDGEQEGGAFGFPAGSFADNLFGGIGTSAEQAGTDARESFLGGFQGTGTALVGGEAATELASATDTLGKDVGVRLVHGFGVSLTDEFPGLALLIGRLLSKLADAVTRVARLSGERISSELAKGMAVELVDGVRDLASTLIRAFADIGRLVGTVAFTSGKSIGLRFGLGISEGLVTVTTLVVGVVLRMAQLMVQVMERVLDINSPSEVAASMGEQFGMGLAQGLERTASAVAAASGSLAASITTAASEALAAPEFTDPTVTAAVTAVDASTAITDAQVTAVSGRLDVRDSEALSVLNDILLAMRANGTDTSTGRDVAEYVAAFLAAYGAVGGDRSPSPNQVAKDIDLVATIVRP